MDSTLHRACGCIVRFYEDEPRVTIWCAEHAKAAAVEIKDVDWQARAVELERENERLREHVRWIAKQHEAVMADRTKYVEDNHNLETDLATERAAREKEEAERDRWRQSYYVVADAVASQSESPASLAATARATRGDRDSLAARLREQDEAFRAAIDAANDAHARAEKAEAEVERLRQQYAEAVQADTTASARQIKNQATMIERLTIESAKLRDALAAERAMNETITQERDAYKRAKQENDDRFMGERDEARRERDALAKRVRELETAVRSCQTVACDEGVNEVVDAALRPVTNAAPVAPCICANHNPVNGPDPGCSVHGETAAPVALTPEQVEMGKELLGRLTARTNLGDRPSAYALNRCDECGGIIVKRIVARGIYRACAHCGKHAPSSPAVSHAETGSEPMIDAGAETFSIEEFQERIDRAGARYWDSVVSTGRIRYLGRRQGSLEHGDYVASFTSAHDTHLAVDAVKAVLPLARKLADSERALADERAAHESKILECAEAVARAEAAEKRASEAEARCTSEIEHAALMRDRTQSHALEIIDLKRRLAEAESACAAMREVLHQAAASPTPYSRDGKFERFWHTQPHERPCLGCDIEDALVSTAGTALLDDLRQLRERNEALTNLLRELIEWHERTNKRTGSEIIADARDALAAPPPAPASDAQGGNCAHGSADCGICENGSDSK